MELNYDHLTSRKVSKIQNDDITYVVLLTYASCGHPTAITVRYHEVKHLICWMAVQVHLKYKSTDNTYHDKLNFFLRFTNEFKTPKFETN